MHELNLYAPRFISVPYIMIGYTINNLDQIPTFNGTVTDMDLVKIIEMNMQIESFSFVESKIKLWVFMQFIIT